MSDRPGPNYRSDGFRTMTANDSRMGYLDLAVVVLSFYVLGALVADTFLHLQPEVSRLLTLVDDLICVFFLFEFCVRFYRAEDKIGFWKWGWIDLISSIPTLEYLRPGRTLRLIRLLRILRAFRSLRFVINHVFRRRFHGVFSSVALIAVMVVIFSSIAILQVEDAPNSNIKTAEDALWWAYATVTTVGYGDKYPVTTEGRLIAAVLMTVGVGLFGTFTGYVASWFVEERANDQKDSERGTDNV